MASDEFPALNVAISKLFAAMDVKEATTASAAARIELSALIAERDALREQVRWIPVGERLPEQGERAFVFSVGDGSGIRQGQLTKFEAGIPDFWIPGDGRAYATHWMPLLKAPSHE